MDYTVSIDQFEGPFDLLLHLIRKNEIDICDISIAQITDQYIETIRSWESLNMEVASEFIVVASRLLEIKSKTLLPKNNEEEEPESESDLTEQLRMYKAFKQAAAFLSAMADRERGAFYKDPEYLPELEKPKRQAIDIDSGRLLKELRRLITVYEDDHTLRAAPRAIERDHYTLEEQITVVCSYLAKISGSCSFDDMLSDRKRGEVVTTFQALLELYKTNVITLEQSGSFKTITISEREKNSERETDQNPV